MKIDFVRSGGFGGLRLSVSLDTADLSAEQASRIETLVESARFFDLREQSPSVASMPDSFQYHVVVSGAAQGMHSVVVAEKEVPNRLQPLLDYLTARALGRGDAGGNGEAGT